MTRFREEVFAAMLLKINPRGNRQSRLSLTSSWMDRMAHTEILELTLVNWAGVAEIDATMHRFDARWWTKSCGGGRTRDGWPANLVVGGMGKEAGV